MSDPISIAIRDAMERFAEQLRKASLHVKDGFYDDDAQRAINSARRETLSDVAGAIDSMFPEDE
ncbi:MAG TPA: hypothetical protein VFO62_10650 [Candidatus Binatia bacterium]|nr:hypothetical protein [Candidatus Binatia bacterium]